MIFLFLELLKHCLQLWKKSPDHITWPKSHVSENVSHSKAMMWHLLSFFPQQPLHKMPQFFLLSGLFLICFLLMSSLGYFCLALLLHCARWLLFIALLLLVCYCSIGVSCSCLFLIMKLWDTYLASGWLFCFMVLDGCCWCVWLVYYHFIGVLSFFWCVIASFVLSPHIDKTIPLPLISILPPVHCARPKLILGGTGFSSRQLLGCRYLEYMALKLVCLCYHSIGVLSLYWCVTTLLSSHSVWHCLKLS